MFKPHYGQCKECPAGTTQLIVVKAGLCKLHNEKKKAKNKTVKKVVLDMFWPMQNRQLINKVSVRERKNIAAKINTYKKFDELMQYQDKVYCSNCGQPKYLSHSHLVPVSFNKKLEKVISNIVYHCTFRPGFVSCHDLYESHDPEIISQMRDYEDNMAKIKLLDESYYKILINKKKV